jgi:hypothetical protein
MFSLACSKKNKDQIQMAEEVTKEYPSGFPLPRPAQIDMSTPAASVYPDWTAFQNEAVPKLAAHEKQIDDQSKQLLDHQQRLTRIEEYLETVSRESHAPIVVETPTGPVFAPVNAVATGETSETAKAQAAGAAFVK